VSHLEPYLNQELDVLFSDCLDRLHQARAVLPAEEEAVHEVEPLSLQDGKEIVENLKALGSAGVKQGQYDEARGLYEEALQVCRRIRAAGETGEDVAAWEVALSSNASLCCLKTQLWQGAADHASRALSLQHDNAKALFRRASGYHQLNRLQEALQDLDVIQEEDQAVRNLRTLIKKQLAKHRAKEKKAFGRMFASSEPGAAAGMAAAIASEVPAAQHQHACSGGEAPTPPPPPAAVFDLGGGLEALPGRLVSKGHEQLAMEAQCFLASLPEASASTDAARQAMGVGMTLCNRLKEAGATAEEALLRQAVVGVIQGGAGR